MNQGVNIKDEADRNTSKEDIKKIEGEKLIKEKSSIDVAIHVFVCEAEKDLNYLFLDLNLAPEREVSVRCKMTRKIVSASAFDENSSQAVAYVTMLYAAKNIWQGMLWTNNE
jgi:hypothetical protein